MLRVLNIIGSMDRGGAETFLINIYRKMDRKKIQFDFLVCSDNRENSYIDEILELGGKIFKVPTKKENIICNLMMIYKIVKKEGYQIVWRHTSSPLKALDLVMARLGGAGRTILHSHSIALKGEGACLGILLRPILLLFVTDRFACGGKAGQWLYGKRDFIIIPNGIDVNRFCYNEQVRRQYREQFKVGDKFVVGHVGRFDEEKNHKFIIEIFSRFVAGGEDAVLMLAGEGKLRKTIEQEVEEKGISDKVYFLGVRDDVECLLQMFDVFLFPSLFEGVPVTLIEAQAADLSCVLSENIPHEIKLTEKVQFLGLDESVEKWAEAVRSKCKDTTRESRREVLKEQGFDIVDTAKMIEQRFLQM